MQLLSKEIDEVATVLSPSCYFQYANMACLLCSPNSASFVNETVYPATISVCETLCNQFFNSCNSDDFAILFGPSVEPNNGFAFCQLLFNDDLDDQDSTVHVVVSNSTSNGACFSGVTNIASISNAQGVCITATNGTKPIVPNDACLPSTQPLLLLFLFALFALLL
jgi:hypothetical protein